MRTIQSVTLVAFAIMLHGIGVRAADTPDANAALRTMEGSGVQYLLSRPENWTPDSTWPILVALEGSGHDFQGNFNNFVKARRDRPFIIVTPCVRSNGRNPKDRQAVLAIVKEVQALFNGQPKFFITGFSAGGHLAWQFVFVHPELLAGAAPAAANFVYRGLTPQNVATHAPERVKLPIHGFLGEKDAYKKFLDPQWAQAAQFARENGYENLTFTEVPGANHQAFSDRVVDFFASLLTKQSD